MQALVIGNFDGVHLGHRNLFRRARAAAEGGRVVAATFEPLPAAVLRPERPMGRLTPNDERSALLRDWCGVDEIVVLEPTPALLGRTPEAFIAELRARIRFDAIVEGPDFRFGRGRSGGLDTLRALGALHGFRVVEASSCAVDLTDGSRVEARSSVARALLAEGRVADAACVFGRPYELRCRTAQGDQRGRTIGCPTTNLDPVDPFKLVPANGVYAVSATLRGRTYGGMLNIGVRPTAVERGERTIEAHLFGLGEEVYGEQLELRMVARLRDERGFAGLDALKEQLHRDREAALAALTNT